MSLRATIYKNSPFALHTIYPIGKFLFFYNCHEYCNSKCVLIKMVLNPVWVELNQEINWLITVRPNGSVEYRNVLRDLQTVIRRVPLCQREQS